MGRSPIRPRGQIVKAHGLFGLGRLHGVTPAQRAVKRRRYQKWRPKQMRQAVVERILGRYAPQ